MNCPLAVQSFCFVFFHGNVDLKKSCVISGSLYKYGLSSPSNFSDIGREIDGEGFANIKVCKKG